MRGGLIQQPLVWLSVGLVCTMPLPRLWGASSSVAVNHWRVERAIKRFETHPSQAAAHTLVRLIEDHVPTADQGERILQHLLKPTVTKRTAYPMGKRPTIALTAPYAVPLKDARLSLRERILAEGGPPYVPEQPALVLGSLPQIKALPITPDAPGTYASEIRQRYTIHLHPKEHTWSWHPLSSPFPRCLLPYKKTQIMRCELDKTPDYARSIVVHTKIVAVEPSQAEKIEVVSNPTLDRAIKEPSAPKPL